MRYYYWHCKKCYRWFRSLRDGGRLEVYCICGKGSRHLVDGAFSIEEVSKSDYDIHVQEQRENESIC